MRQEMKRREAVGIERLFDSTSLLTSYLASLARLL